MLLSLTVLGIFLSVILLYFNARNYASSIYLGVFFLLISVYNFNQFVVLESKSVFLVSLFYLNIGFLSYLIGPMLYWYIRSVLTDDPRMKKTDLLHLLPMFIFFMAIIPHLLSSWSYKVEIATKIVENGNFLGSYKSTLLAEVFSTYVVYLSRPVLILVYATWSLNLFLGYLKKKKEPKTLIHQNLMKKWLAVLFVFLTIWFVSHTLQIIESNIAETLNVFYTLNTLKILSGFGLVGLLVLPFFFPAILYGLPRLPESIVPLIVIEKAIKNEQGETDGSPVTERKNQTPFETDYILHIKHKVELCMEEVKPYLQPDCNLGYVSKLINIPAHHLSYYFREEKNQSFNDYRNEWRVNYAKNLIREGRAKELTLEAIGRLSGFSSRKTFLSVCKKIEGISPGIFAEQFAK